MATVTDVIKSLIGGEERIHDGGNVTWTLGPAVFECLEDLIKPGMVTAETGVGHSTIFFAAKGCRHSVFAPILDEFLRTCELAKRHGIDLSKLSYYTGESQDTLPRVHLDPLDCALIDGGHGFPVPFVDWVYFAKNLKIGGILVVDDVNLWTGEVLRDFLKAELHWEPVKDFPGCSIFKKKGHAVLQDWGAQPYVVARGKIRKDWPWLFNVCQGHLSGLREVVAQAKVTEKTDLNIQRVDQFIAELNDLAADFASLKNRG